MLSREFAARLSRLGPGQKLRVVVMLHTDAGNAGPRSRSRANRQETVSAIRGSAEQALSDIDRILARFDGHRLAEGPSVLGTIPVETTAAGITELAASEYVEAILEDQRISLLAGRR